jgi:predicted PurR-regulated permease PerM
MRKLFGVAGFVGAILAVPSAAIVQVLAQEFATREEPADS